MIAAAQIVTGRFLATFADLPPRQKAASFAVDQAMEKLEASFTTGH
jgi:arylsulfatase